MQNSLILRRHEYNSLQGNNFISWLKAVLMTIVIGVVHFMYFQDAKSASPLLIYPLTLAAFSIWFFLFVKFIKKAKVEISESGIEYKGGLPDLLSRLDPDWKVSWEDIKQVSFTRVVMRNTLMTPLQIKKIRKTFKLIPSQWAIPNKPSKAHESSSIFERLFSKEMDYELLVENSPLVKIFKKKGFLKDGTSLEKLESEYSGINSNPIAIGMAIFFIISVFYFIGDVYFGLSEFYVKTPPYLWIIGGGILVAFLSYSLLKDSDLKSVEKIIMVVLVGFGAALITYPLLLRVNELMDNNGLQNYSYELAEKGIWMPRHNNIQIPNVTFDLQTSDYWDQFKIGAIKDFELRKGGLGFYQLNMKPVYEEQREFYHDKREVVAESIK